MNPGAQQKVTSSHLKRNAYLYIRQSTLRQVLENTERCAPSGNSFRFLALNQ